ncbi:MAG: MFS transporter [Gammaproteobacteria bacterium]
MNSFRRNVPLLAMCQALMMSSMSLIITTAALVGFTLAEDKSLATLPLAAQFIATMLTSIPAAMLMDRIGRKAGFMLATVFGASGATIATLAIAGGEFWFFLLGTVLMGIFNGFGTYFRFAAADAVPEEKKSRAISYIMAGGVVAAVVGPNVANLTRDGLYGVEFAGSYAAVVSFYLLAFVVMLFLKLPGRDENPTAFQAPQRPLGVIARQPRFRVAVICGMLGYGVMTLVMTATPLAMHHEAHTFANTSFVIQWHILGMFAPSFFTGHLIKRFGEVPIMLWGVVFGLLCVAINLLGASLSHFWVALFLLGLSWNFLFVGATTLLTATYAQSERAKTQAVNDFVVFTTVAVASLSAGTLQHQFGWQAVNLGVLPLLLIMLLALLWLRRTAAPAYGVEVREQI